MRQLGFTFALLLISAPASAQGRGYIDGFIGWSADRSFFAITTAGTDEIDLPVLCLSHKNTASPSWPKNVPVPTEDDPDGCTPSLDMVFQDGQLADKLVEMASALVASPVAGRTGPKGETFTLKRANPDVVEVSVTRGGKRIARGFFDLKRTGASIPDAPVAYWRDDDGAVAIVAGYAPLADPGPGYGPPRYLVVLDLGGSMASTPAPPTRRQRAKEFNVDGMKLLLAKKLDQAQDKFTAATDADETYALAYYNLACTASLRKEKQTALTALRHLDILAARDPEAKKAIAKGLTDHDLDFIATDPEAAKLLGRVKKTK
jgi:hypothetical protein